MILFPLFFFLDTLLINLLQEKAGHLVWFRLQSKGCEINCFVNWLNLRLRHVRTWTETVNALLRQLESSWSSSLVGLAGYKNRAPRHNASCNPYLIISLSIVELVVSLHNDCLVFPINTSFIIVDGSDFTSFFVIICVNRLTCVCVVSIIYFHRPHPKRAADVRLRPWAWFSSTCSGGGKDIAWMQFTCAGSIWFHLWISFWVCAFYMWVAGGECFGCLVLEVITAVAERVCNTVHCSDPKCWKYPPSNTWLTFKSCFVLL